MRFDKVDYDFDKVDKVDNGLDYSDKSFDNADKVFDKVDKSFGGFTYLAMPCLSATRNYFFWFSSPMRVASVGSFLCGYMTTNMTSNMTNGAI